MPALHRLAGIKATQEGTEVTAQIIDRHEQITRILGGEYWKECLFSSEDTKVREDNIVAGYEKRLSSTGYLTYTGSCPIRERQSSATKYFMVFASRHRDAMILFNDEMCKATNEFVTEREMGNSLPLFPDLAWEYWRDKRILNSLVTKCVKKFPGRNRKDLRRLFIRGHFAQFTQSEFNKAVSALVESGKIICSTPIGSPLRKTKRLNDNCVLEPRE